MNTVNFQVAGIRYRQADFEKANDHQGDRLTLKAEPTNKYDPYAIQVLAGKAMIGYVPHTHTALLTEIVNDPQGDLHCVATNVWPGGCCARAMWAGVVETKGTL